MFSFWCDFSFHRLLLLSVSAFSIRSSLLWIKYLWDIKVISFCFYFHLTRCSVLSGEKKGWYCWIRSWRSSLIVLQLNVFTARVVRGADRRRRGDKMFLNVIKSAERIEAGGLCVTTLVRWAPLSLWMWFWSCRTRGPSFTLNQGAEVAGGPLLFHLRARWSSWLTPC